MSEPQFRVKKVFDVWAVLDKNGNEVSEHPTRDDAVKFARSYEPQ